MKDPQTQAILRKAWTDSHPGTGVDPLRMEQGGYVVQDPSGTETLSPFNSTSASGMTLTPRPAGDVLLSFHTHPNIGVDPVTGLVWNPGPSQADFLTFATHPELAPHFVVAQPGVYQIADPFGGKFLFPDRVRVLGGH